MGARTTGYSVSMIILGIILLVLGMLLDVGILWTIGIVFVVIGAVLYAAGALGRGIGGRPHYW